MLSPLAAAVAMQNKDVTAAPMLRVAELEDYPFFCRAGIPAPLMGEHSMELARQLLDLDDERISRLLDSKVLFDACKAMA